MNAVVWNLFWLKNIKPVQLWAWKSSKEKYSFHSPIPLSCMLIITFPCLSLSLPHSFSLFSRLPWYHKVPIIVTSTTVSLKPANQLGVSCKVWYIQFLYLKGGAVLLNQKALSSSMILVEEQVKKYLKVEEEAMEDRIRYGYWSPKYSLGISFECVWMSLTQNTYSTQKW